MKKLFPLALITLVISCSHKTHNENHENVCDGIADPKIDSALVKAGIEFKSSENVIFYEGSEEIYIRTSTQKEYIDSAYVFSKAGGILYDKNTTREKLNPINATLVGDSIEFKLQTNETILVQKAFLQRQPGGSVPPFDQCNLNNNTQNRIMVLQMQARANHCCCPLRYCFPICQNGRVTRYVMAIFSPNPPCITMMTTMNLFFNLIC